MSVNYSSTIRSGPPWSHALTGPSPSSSLPTARPALTPAQQIAYQSLLSHVSSLSFILPSDLRTWRSARKQPPPSSSSPPKGWAPLSAREKCYWTEEGLLRVLRSLKYDVGKAISRAEETTVWRREYGVENMTPEEVEEESRTGKQFTLGYDAQMRPCFYMHPYRQNTKVSPRQIRFVVWCLERTMDLMPAGVEQLCLLIDFGAPDVKGGGGQPTTLGQAKQVLTILQTYYCERLGRAVCINVPWLFWSFYKIIGPFVDSATREKIWFNPSKASKADLASIVPKEQLEKKCFGGELEFEYDHDEYFSFATRVAFERHEAMFRRYKELGEDKVGVSELLLRGGGDSASSVLHVAPTPSVVENSETNILGTVPITSGTVRSHSSSVSSTLTVSSSRSHPIPHPFSSAPTAIVPPSSAHSADGSPKVPLSKAAGERGVEGGGGGGEARGG